MSVTLLNQKDLLHPHRLSVGMKGRRHIYGSFLTKVQVSDFTDRIKRIPAVFILCNVAEFIIF